MAVRILPQSDSWARALPVGAGLRALAARAAGRLATWHQVARERRGLRELDDRLLADMGLPPDAVAREAARRFWDA